MIAVAAVEAHAAEAVQAAEAKAAEAVEASKAAAAEAVEVAEAEAAEAAEAQAAEAAQKLAHEHSSRLLCNKQLADARDQASSPSQCRRMNEQLLLQLRMILREHQAVAGAWEQQQQQADSQAEAVLLLTDGMCRSRSS